MSELSLMGWVTAGISALLLGMTKAGIPGLGMVAIPLMASIFPAKISTGVMLPILLVGDALAVVYYHRHADWRLLWRLLPVAVVGVVIGYFLMSRINDSQLRIGIGVIVFVLVVLTALRNRGMIRDESIPQRLWVAVVTGIVAGITTMLANAAGPVMMVYLLAMRYSKNEFIGTGAWFFMIINWIKVPFSISLGLITWESLLLDLKLVPLIILGGFVGIVVVKRISEKAYIIWVQVLAGLAALRLIFG